ncbi:hypothetical protein AC1031_005367 [Aphanomyces cochlioides]|nr:hypothetical protein AC1031_005367 [Aphanomyces cochlioides]
MVRVAHLASVVAAAVGVAASGASKSTKRCFPDDFLWGTATASYQVEGAWNETGRTPSIWDDFCRKNADVQCANVADDFVHRYKGDIAIMKHMGLSTFRLSISWSRLMTWNNTTKKMERNQPGIDFYHSLLDTLHAAKIKPVVTLYHWDLPLALQTNVDGWLDPSIVTHFNEYAELVFEEFGAKAQYWTTFNEPTSFVLAGYAEQGRHPPEVKNSDTAAYLAAHHVLLSHANAVKTFRSKSIDGQIGIVLVSNMAFPLDKSSPQDQEAAERVLQFYVGWYLNPIVNGDYPEVMKKRAGAHLPQFTAEESALLKGSYDVFMFNHYSSNLVTDCASPTSEKPCAELARGWAADLGVDAVRFPVGSRPASTNANGDRLCTWFNGYPEGYLPYIRWGHAFNKSTPILLTENGWCGNSTIDNQDQLWYYQGYVDQVWQGIQEGIPIIGYHAWSFVDNYEWGSFEPRFGLFHVDFPAETGSKEGYTPRKNDLKLTPRPAAFWYEKLAKTNCLPEEHKKHSKHEEEAETVELAAATPKQSMSLLSWGFFGAVAALAGFVYRMQRRQQRRILDEQTPLVTKDL